MTNRKFTTALVAAMLVGLAAWLVASTALGSPPDASAAPSGGRTAQAADGFEWFWAINGPVSADGGSDMSVDEDGNVFIAGGHGGLDMDRDGVVDLPSGGTSYVGASNSFLMKMSQGPTDERVRLRWTRSPSNPADRSQTKVAADGRGGAFISGAFMETISFEGGPTVHGGGGNDAYVAHYDGEGSVTWAHAFGGAGGDAIYDVASDHDGNVYVVGVGAGTFPLDDRGAEFRADGDRAAVLLSYDIDGALRWSRVLGSGVPLAFVVTNGTDGEILVSGEMEGAADFDGDGRFDLPAPRDRDGFVAKFDQDGVLLGAWAVGAGPGRPAVGPGGDIFFLGGVGGQWEQRYGPADFDGDGRADVELKGGGPTGAVLARYSPDGRLRWARSYTLETPADLAIRGNRVLVPGNYHGVRDLDEDGEAERVDQTVDASLETDMAILILSTDDGRPEGVWTAPGPGNDWANAVAFQPKDASVYITGSIQLTADFTGDGEFGEGWVVCENLGDVFFAQYRLHIEEERVAEVPREEVTLTATGRELEGTIEGSLAWTGLTSAEVDVYRNDRFLLTTANDGEHINNIARGTPGPWSYRVCEAGTQVCSNTVGLNFGPPE
jgi:hypothetical protein